MFLKEYIMKNTERITEDRINEIAYLLAIAIKRLTSREIAKNIHISLDFEPHPSINEDKKQSL